MDEYYANDHAALGGGYGNSKLFGGASPLRESPEKQKQSQIEAALDRLAKMVEIARCDLTYLQAQLAPVSQPVPIEGTAKSNQGQKPASCAIEARIEEITNCIIEIGGDLRSARSGLCV